MILTYQYIHQFGRNQHRIEFYSSWSASAGLEGFSRADNDSNFNKMYKRNVDFLSKAQKNMIRKIAQKRPGFIVIGASGDILESRNQ